MRPCSALLAAVLVALCCAAPARAAPQRKLGAVIAAHADALIGLPSVHEVSRDEPDDCVGFVRAVYGAAGIDLRATRALPGDNGVTGLFRTARAAHAFHRRGPRPGDLVFFRETYDRNRDGLRNDGLTHVGVVDRVRGGVVEFVHRASSGIERSRLDLRHPRAKDRNDALRRASAHRRAYLAGELVSGFASPERLRPRPDPQARAARLSARPPRAAAPPPRR